MIRIAAAAEPYWLPIRGDDVAVLVRPLTTAVYEGARAKATRAVIKRFGEADGDDDDTGLPEDEDAADDRAARRAGEMAYLFAVCLAQAAIVEWRGFGDQAGEPVAATPANIAAAMARHDVSDRFLRGYSAPLEQVSAEGNASPTGPNGTPATVGSTASAAATTTPPAPAETAG